MSLANPLGLLGLFSLPVIVLLHAMRERNRRYLVSSLSLWSFLDIQVRGTRARRIPITWLLLLDLLIALLLTLAWTSPRMNLNVPAQSARHVVVLLDVSTSMLAEDGFSSRFVKAKQEAVSLLGTLGPRDVGTVITFGIRTNEIGDTRNISRNELAALVTSLQAGETGHALEAALGLAVAVPDGRIPLEVHVLTDGAFAEPNLSSLDVPIRWHRFGSGVDNQAVLDIAVSELIEQNYQVFARIGNFSDQPAVRNASLLVDGFGIDVVSIEIPPDSTVSYVWNIAGSATTVAVKLSEGDALPEDDIASIGVHPSRSVRVALVTDSPEPVDRALRAVPNVTLTILTPEEYLPGLTYDLVVFRGNLPESWPSGSVLVLEPPMGADLLDVGPRREILSQPAPTAELFLAEVDFTGVRWKWTWTLNRIPEGFAPILLADDLPLLLRGSVGISQIAVFLPDLGSGNLTRHPAFPIFIANVARAAEGISVPNKLYLGERLEIPPASVYPLVTLHLPDGDPLEYQADRPDVWEGRTIPGIYILETLDLYGATETYAFGLNAGQVDESDLRPQEWFSLRAQEVSDPDEGAEQEFNLTPYLLVVVILLFGLEAWMAWR